MSGDVDLQPTRPGRAVAKMVVGLVVWVTGLAAYTPGRPTAVAPYLPIAMMIALVFFGVGLHEILWSGKRRESRLPRSLRSALLAYAVLSVWMVVVLVATGRAAQEGTTFPLREDHYLAHTPGHTWELACRRLIRGDPYAGTEAGAVERIAKSLRLTPGRTP